MTQYVNTDLQVDDRYDLQIVNGDLVIAEAPAALSYITVFRVLTDIAEWPNSPSGVANLGRFIGSLNSDETHRRIERDIMRVLASRLEINPDDLTITVSPTNGYPDEIILVITINNIEYLDRNGILRSNVGITLTFSYSLTNGKIVFIDDVVP